MFLGVIILLPKAIDYLTTTQNTRHGIFLSCLLVRRFQVILQTIEGIGIALGYLSEIKSLIIPEATIHLRKSTWRDQT